MASARRMPTTYNTSTYDSAGGKDYSTLTSWETATDNDLVTAGAGEVLECYRGDHADYLRMDGATTNSSYFRVVKPASGEGHSGIPKNDGSCVAFHVNDTVVIKTALEDYGSIYDIVAYHGSGSTSTTGIFYPRSPYGRLVGCIAYDPYSLGVSFGFWTNQGNGNTQYCINLLAIDCVQGLRSEFGDAYWYNCTSINASEYARIQWRLDSTATAKNVGMPGGTSYGTWSDTSVSTASPTFVDSANDDYHLAASDTTWKDSGTDLSADSIYAFDDDIDGDTRTGTWDIGFDEYIGGGGGISIPVVMHHRQQQGVTG